MTTGTLALLVFLALLPFVAFAVAFVGGMVVCRMVGSYIDAFEAFERAVVVAIVFAAFDLLAIMVVLLRMGACA